MFRSNPPLLLLLVLVSSLEVLGQAARTPFSAFGYGDTFGDALLHNQGMGGVGVSNPQYWYLNNMNPALLAYNRITTFQAGLLLEKKRIYSDTIRENSTGGNLNYLTMGFPLLRNKRTGETRWGTAIGLMPYSHVDYQYEYSKDIIGADGKSIPVNYFEQAKGGINEVYWSNGARLNKYLNVGLKTSFLFSSINTVFTNFLNDPNQLVKYVVNVNELQSIKGVRFTPGIHIHKDSINRKYTLNLGATYTLSSEIRTNFEQVLQRRATSGSILQSDTLNISVGNSNLPNKLTIGASFGRLDKWMFATDFSLVKPNANTFTLGQDQIGVTDGWRFASGFELTPDSRSLGSYLKRMTYRTGISAESGTYLVSGNPVKDFGINFGFSIPVNRISSLDLAFRTGKRGDMKVNGIEENYFKIYFGVTFNDQNWFLKRRFD